MGTYSKRELLERVAKLIKHPELAGRHSVAGKSASFAGALTVRLIETGDDDPEAFGEGFHVIMWGNRKVATLASTAPQYAASRQDLLDLLAAKAAVKAAELEQLTDQAVAEADALLRKVVRP